MPLHGIHESVHPWSSEGVIVTLRWDSNFCHGVAALSLCRPHACYAWAYFLYAKQDPYKYAQAFFLSTPTSSSLLHTHQSITSSSQRHMERRDLFVLTCLPPHGPGLWPHHLAVNVPWLTGQAQAATQIYLSSSRYYKFGNRFPHRTLVVTMNSLKSL